MTTSGSQTWWRAVLTYPPTWAAGTLLAALSAGFVAVLDPGTAMVIGTILVVVLAVAGWPLAMAMTGTLSSRQFAIADPDAPEAAMVASLERELASLDDTQPAEQLVALQQKRAALIKVLDRRLDPSELTYARYKSTSQQVYRSALDNLHEVAVANDSLSSIDTGYIQRRITELDAEASNSDSSQRERETLAQRAQLRDDQVARIGRLLAQNEAALTTLDRTTGALADVPVGQRPEEADEAMAALADLADRARMLAVEDGS
ncbi:MAG: hypothetical protein WA964_02955 [Ilumatobacter sp.]|uniref:hypothetical protein n=1 Tax=Ilumatobacter sp. TaxID=1967498 RepID=UPI003C762646